jgi:hypothetical protein
VLSLMAFRINLRTDQVLESSHGWISPLLL